MITPKHDVIEQRKASIEFMMEHFREYKFQQDLAEDVLDGLHGIEEDEELECLRLWPEVVETVTP